MLAFLGDHFLYLVGAGMSLFAAALIFVSTEDAFKRHSHG